MEHGSQKVGESEVRSWKDRKMDNAKRLTLFTILSNYYILTTKYLNERWKVRMSERPEDWKSDNAKH